jgi:nucleoside-diphosphate-sugar epimerase
MNILVTGASGFIGKHVAREVQKRGHRVIALTRSAAPRDAIRQPHDADIVCDLSVDELNLSGMNVDVVVHLAASLSGSPAEQYRSTVRGTEKLLDAMTRADIGKLIGISSIAVLDYAGAVPMSRVDENTPRASSEYGPMGAYASAKAKQEDLFAAFGAQPGHSCTILRPGLVYDEAQLIPAHAGIIKGPLRLLAKHGGEVPVVSVTGVARAIVDAVERNVGTAEIIHLVDNDLPSQRAYIASLNRRGTLPAGGIELSWRTLSSLAAVAWRLAVMAGLQRRLPEALLPHSCAGRMKPFRYSNAKAQRLLGWAPDGQFA